MSLDYFNSTHYDPCIDRHTFISLDNPEEVSDDDACWEEEEIENDAPDIMSDMDKFYRVNELFVCGDSSKISPQYGTDDVCLSDDIRYRNLPIEFRTPHEIDTDIRKTKRYSNDSYVYDMSILNNEIAYRMAQGYTYEQALNILDKASTVKDLYDRYAFARESFNLARKGYTTPEVLEAMDNALVKKACGDKYFEGTLQFLDLFPDERDVIIEKIDKHGNEFYRPVNATFFGKLYYMANDKDNIKRILEDCTLDNPSTNYRHDADRDLCLLACDMLAANNGEWDANATKIMNRIKRRNRQNYELIDYSIFSYVHACTYQGYKNDEILDKLYNNC